MTGEVTIRLTGELSTAGLPGPCGVPRAALPVRCLAVTGSAIGTALLTPREGSETEVDVAARLAPALWLFGPYGLGKYSRLSFGAKPYAEGYRLCDVCLCEPGDTGSWPYTVEATWA